MNEETLVLSLSATLAQLGIITILVVTSIFFLILLVIGVLKSYKLKKENDKLSQNSTTNHTNKKQYQDFRSGHLYDSK